VPRGEPGRFDDLFSEADAERLVCSGALRYPAFRLVKEGSKLAVRDYTTDLSWRPAPFTGTADVRRVTVEFEAGATIVFQALHHSQPPVAELCRALETELGHPVQANAYWTPRDSQGLAVHHDTHDVFVLQVAGEKRWVVYEPVLELPLRNQRYTKALGEPGEPVLDLTLCAGDVLYLPRGWLHEALTSSSDSLHVTVGVNVISWLEAVRAALDDCADDLEFRRSVPEDGEGQADLLAALAERLAPPEVARRKRAKLVSKRRPILDGQISELRALDELTAETLLERRPAVLADIDDATLSFEGRDVAFAEDVAEELEWLLAADGPFRAAELPGELDEEGRLALVSRLIREGFLRRSVARD